MPAIDLVQALTILQAGMLTHVTGLRVDRPLGQAVGSVAAETVAASVDHPPAEQSLRDGVAYASPPPSDIQQWWRETAMVPPSSDLENVRQIVGQVFPGDPCPTPLTAGQAVRVMTGAVLPLGTVGVAMLEDVEWLSSPNEKSAQRGSDSPWSVAIGSRHVVLPVRPPRTHILSKGAIYQRGDELISPGTRLQPVHIGLLASTGRDFIQCFSQPKVAVLTTGDELVEAGSPLRPGHVYNSNGPLLRALLSQAGLIDVTIDHLGDSEAQISDWLEQKLGQVDLVVTTGAVSAGQKDQLPHLFQRHGVQTLFHGVNIKPGKPIFCGRYEVGSRTFGQLRHSDTMVLGLPGNPISVWVTFLLFGRPLLDSLQGVRHKPRWLVARLSRTGNFQDSRLTFWPGQLTWSTSPWALHDLDHREDLADDLPLVTPLEWQGSPDLRSPTAANCLIYFPTSGPSLTEDSRVHVLLLPNVT